MQRNACWWHNYCECSSMSVQRGCAAWGLESSFSERLQCMCSLLCFEQLQMAFKSNYKTNLSDLGPTLAGFLHVSAAKYRPEMSEASPHATWELKESGQPKPKQAPRVSEDCAIEPGQGLDAEQKLFYGDVSGQRHMDWILNGWETMTWNCRPFIFSESISSSGEAHGFGMLWGLPWCFYIPCGWKITKRIHIIQI